MHHTYGFDMNQCHLQNVSHFVAVLTVLTHKHLETHGCILSIVATDALVQKHQTISTNSADYIYIAFDLFRSKYTLIMNNIRNES